MHNGSDVRRVVQRRHGEEWETVAFGALRPGDRMRVLELDGTPVRDYDGVAEFDVAFGPRRGGGGETRIGVWPVEPR